MLSIIGKILAKVCIIAGFGFLIYAIVLIVSKEQESMPYSYLLFGVLLFLIGGIIKKYSHEPSYSDQSIVGEAVNETVAEIAGEVIYQGASVALDVITDDIGSVASGIIESIDISA